MATTITEVILEAQQGIINQVDPESITKEVVGGLIQDLAYLLAENGIFNGSISQVRGLVGEVPGVVVTNDFGGGLWRFDPTDNTSADNTGTILVTSEGRRYKRVYDGDLFTKWFGAIGNGIIDDTEAFKQCFSLSVYGKSVYISGGGSYVINDTIIVPEGVKVVGNGCTLTTTNDSVIMMKALLRSEIHDISFVGTDSDNGLQGGVIIDGGPSSTDAYRVKIIGCNFDDFGGTALTVINSYNPRIGNIIDSCEFRNCKIGYASEAGGEYVSVVGCHFYGCQTNVYVKGGNNFFTGCIIVDATDTNVHIIPGPNDAHGAFTGCAINHGVGFNVLIDAINTYDFQFTGCDFYQGDIWLRGCKGIRFNGGTISIANIYEDGALNCFFNDVYFLDAPIIHPNFNAHPSKVIYSNCMFDDVSVSMNSNLRWNSARSARARTGSIQVMPNGNGNIVDLNQTDYNAIPGNTNFTLNTFWDATNLYWNIIDNQIFNNKDEWSKCNVCLSIGASSSFDDTKVEVYLYDVHNSIIVGTFTHGVLERIGQLNFYKIFTFNGVVPKGKIQIRVDNMTGGDINLLTLDNGIPSYGEIIGF